MTDEQKIHLLEELDSTKKEILKLKAIAEKIPDGTEKEQIMADIEK